MKKSILFIATMFAAATSTVFAQNDTPSITNRASVFYDLNTLYPSGASNTYFNGYGVGYNIDFKVSDTYPIYVGTGLDVRFVFNNRNITDDLDFDLVSIKAQTTFINFNLPVNVSYRVPVTDKFYLTPFAGLNFRVQAYGNTSLKISVPDNTPEVITDRLVNIDKNINLFSSDDMGDNHLRRFQMAGTQV